MLTYQFKLPAENRDRDRDRKIILLNSELFEHFNYDAMKIDFDFDKTKDPPSKALLYNPFSSVFSVFSVVKLFFILYIYRKALTDLSGLV
jgi:hypothetical protein